LGDQRIADPHCGLPQSPAEIILSAPERTRALDNPARGQA